MGDDCAYKAGWLCEQRMQVLRVRKERTKVIRGGSSRCTSSGKNGEDGGV
jgi:hypothetical protein